MQKLKVQNGITLVALVITIIVLIILAGVSISIVLGDNGIATKARMGAQNYQNAAKEEMGLINTLLDNVSFNGNGGGNTPAPTYTQYTLGQEVTVGGEQFFVIEENDTTSKDTITLITKYNLNPSSNAQLDAAYGSTAMAFCTDPDSTSKGYWYEAGESSSKYPYELNGVESERATAYNKAKAYGIAKGGTGRLLTKTEAETLKAEGKIQKIIYGQDYTTNPVTTDNFLNFWLGSANNSRSVYSVDGQYGSVNCTSFNYDDYYGVRPVITISKSLVS